MEDLDGFVIRELAALGFIINININLYLVNSHFVKFVDLGKILLKMYLE